MLIHLPMEEVENEIPQGRVAKRQAKIRQRILEVADRLFSSRGMDEVTIDDMASGADISRRSFYHYFDSKHAVLVPLARARTLAVNDRIDRLVAQISDAAEVMATGMRHGLREFSRDPLCSWFVLRSGLPPERLREGVGESFSRDMLNGIAAGRFHVDNLDVVKWLVSGGFIALMSARVEGKVADTDLDDAVEHVLRLLGLEVEDARDLAHRPLRPLPKRGEDTAKAKARAKARAKGGLGTKVSQQTEGVQ